MDRTDLGELFHDHAARHRKDFLLFAAGGTLLSLAIAVALGIALYVGLVAFFGLGLAPGHFLILYALLFLSLGYWQYQRQVSSPASIDQTDEALLRWGTYLRPLPLNEALLFWFWMRFTSFPFLFLHELLEGRHSYTSGRPVEIAFELMSEDGDALSKELLRQKMSAEPAATQRAVALLVQMRFLAFRPGEGGKLLRTLRWEEFLEKVGAKQAPPGAAPARNSSTTFG